MAKNILKNKQPQEKERSKKTEGAEELATLKEQVEQLRKELEFYTQHNLSLFASLDNSIKQQTQTILQHERVAIDYELLAEKVSARLADKVAERVQLPALEVDLNDLALKIASSLTLPTLQVDLDVLAQKICDKLPMPALEVDYRVLSDRLAEKIDLPCPEVDEEALAQSIAEQLEVPALELDLDELSRTVASKVHLPDLQIDPDLFSEALSKRLSLRLQPPLVEVDANDLAAQIVKNLNVSSLQGVTVAKDEETKDEQGQQDAEGEAEVPVAPPMRPSQLGENLRIKRSFESKIRQASPELKYYFGTLKNTLLSYGRVKSGMSWTGDRFVYDKLTVAKINIIGKTLCVYLALDPQDYSLTKYHQKYVGDVKAYESTPMLVKVKSPMGLKRALSLVQSMMEEMDAFRANAPDKDYTKVYAYQTDEQLLAEGKIKIASKGNEERFL